MSHFTKCALKLTNQDAVRAALVDMGHPFQEAAPGATVPVRGYRGDYRRGVFSVNLGDYDVGVLKAADGSFEVVADWTEIRRLRGISGAEYACKLGQRYQYHNVKIACEAKGYTLAEEVDEADGSIRLLVRRWSAE